MKFGVYDNHMRLWLKTKPVVRDGRLFHCDWQESPCYPFASRNNAQTAVDAIVSSPHRPRPRYRVVSEVGSEPSVQQQNLFD